MRASVLTPVMTAAAAVLGSLGTKPQSEWYRSLDKPAWQPPGAAFPLVWTPLYGLIAWGTGRAADAARGDGRRRVLALTGADLAVNAGWCWAFFDRQSPRGGLAAIAVLNGLNLALVREAARHDRVGAAALVPYVAWTGFATALNASIWRRNR
ncbi:TspO/MBR family protein [Nocardioides panaciterrulae]|uniref:Tryptophan-rich sensory protein n=1 Tax=Nocardioides panaciterrulae TaxID=661492 RepID=A0A7Y9E8N8_9ACTN|nr:TspO/MBR family protein [Nocardioides panaciterrulae]NYD43154.1 tryptophan-rich sensory protein [Nocardioides panaciterrulae]